MIHMCASFWAPSTTAAVVVHGHRARGASSTPTTTPYDRCVFRLAQEKLGRSPSLKEWLFNYTKLGLRDLSKPFILRTDASGARTAVRSNGQCSQVPDRKIRLNVLRARLFYWVRYCMLCIAMLSYAGHVYYLSSFSKREVQRSSRLAHTTYTGCFRA